MNCSEVRTRTPLYLGGELSPAEHDAFASHLAGCAECEREIDVQMSLDARLAAACTQDAPDPRRVEQMFRGEVARQRRLRFQFQAGLIAAGIVVLAVALGITWRRSAAPPPWFADAGSDHWDEVVQGQPRRWRTAPGDIERVVEQHGLTYAQVASLADEGYVLDRAKNCGIEGARTLHLVFRNGTKAYSVFLRRWDSARREVRTARRDAEQVSGFDSGRFRAAVVIVGSAGECEKLARTALARL